MEETRREMGAVVYNLRDDAESEMPRTMQVLLPDLFELCVECICEQGQQDSGLATAGSGKRPAPPLPSDDAIAAAEEAAAADALFAVNV